MSVGLNPGFSNFSVDNSQIGQEFKDGLKNKTADELVDMLGQRDLGPQAKLEVCKELYERMKAKGGEGADGAGGAGGGQGEDMMELLKKLLEGKISPEELKKLSGMLGVDVASLEKIKGAGESGGQQGSADADITGG